MLRSQPASSSSARGGKRSRLGSRGRQKHKRLDSICDNALNRDNEIEIKNIEGKNEAEPMENGSDLRRSTRVRRAPAVLDVSPPPPKRRRKNGRGRGKFHAGLASPSETVDSSKRGFSAARSSEGDSDDDSGDWKSRLRTRVSSSRQVKARDSPHGKRSLFKHLDEVSSSRQVKARDAPHGKRRLFKDLDEVEQAEEVISLSEDDSMDEEEDGRKSRMVKSTRPGTVRAELSCSAESHGELEDEQRKPEMDTALDGSDVDEKLHAQVENNSPEAESDAPVHKGDTDETSLLSGMNEASMVKLSKAVREKEVCPGSQLEGKHICNSVEPTDAHDSAMEVPDLGDDVHKETSPKRNDTSVVNASKQCEAQVSDGMSKLIDPIEDVKTDETDPRHVPVAVAKESNVPSIPQEKPLKDKAASEKDMSRISNIRYRPKCIIEGRRCGLCGGGTDGKPPKILIHDTAGNEHEPYSGSSGPEEPDYDVCDGFAEEPGWLGRLLGPINDRHGIAGIWVHQQCAVWSPEVYFAGVGCLKNVRAAIFRGKALKCTRCGRPGATTGCRIDRCPRTYHLPCARASRCIFDHRKFLIACTDHRRLFQPQGYNYIKLVKKLKAKKMKLEIRKQSVDACRKDLEAEEKWLEKCGEDEEFLKRESKRLQRDMARVAPVYIGGSHSEGEKLFEDWESVAGLQDVIRCMKEVVILPLLYPEFFDNMGLTPPRGILLHGYPGTGKTLVVRALIGSCARGDKRIAYFARKGADCLGKYVGDAERQLRLLFQVAEKSQPSIIFFDEIDGLAPVRSRQQDQTHSSVVSTLLALMDGLKNRGSVIVIGATNRPDAVDPALRRPGRFDREIYFPLPSVKDRAAIVALHTRRWPKPLDSSLLDWIARRTVGFAGADLQALCTHAAVTAVKRRCPLHKILSDTGKSELTGKQPHLPSFVVDKQDWLEALSSVPPPCSRREAGNAAHEVSGNPLSLQLVPCLLQPLSSLIVSLYLDERIWLPSPLYSAGKSIQRTIISSLQENLHHADKWWSHVHQLLLKSDVSNKIVTDLSHFGIVAGDTISGTCDISNDIFDDNKRRIGPWHHDSNLFGVPANRSIYGKRAGYRMLIAGNPKSGQKHLASCFIQCFVGNIEIQKIDMATMSHEGQGDMIQGMANVLFKCASLKSCAVYLPRIDLWALEESAPLLVSQTSDEDGSDHADGLEDCSNCGVPHSSGESENQEENCASGSWKSFTEQFGSICVSTSLIVLATSEVPYEELPLGVRQFFGSSDPLFCKGSTFSEHTVPRITVELNGEFDRDKMAYSSASKLSWDLIRQFIQLLHHRIHPVQESSILGQIEDDSSMPKHNNLDHMSTEEPKSGVRGPEDGVRTTAAPCTNRIMKGRSNLMMAITSFGYQILTYPHFAELCWVTSKLKEGPYANVIGPWKGWPFNSCIVRPTSAPEKKDVVPSSNKDKQQFSSVRGLIAVGLSAYRGLYTSLSHVSLEIRKVLELLVGEINARIQSGKEGYQFVSLLSQVAYLEDMVNNWVYSLRSLEIDAQILLANQSLNPPSSPVEDIPKPVTTERSMGNDSVECGLVHNEIQNTGIRSMKETTNTREHSPTEMSVNPDKESCQILASEAPNFQEESSRGGSEEGDALCSIDVENLVADPSCLRTSDGVAHEVFLSENHEYVQVRVNNGFAETGPSHLSGREFLGTDTDHLKHAENGAHVDDAKPNCEMDVESTKPSEDPQLVCSYRCCLGCMRALLELVQKAVDMEWEPYGDSLTVEDAYDLVGSLSSRLGSMTQKLYVDESLIGSVRSKGGSSDKRNSLPDSAGMKVDVCKCSTWESDSFIPRKCTCHSGSSSESNSLVSREVGFSSIFVYKDGVLVSSDSEKDALFHCTYEDLCLCSLVELLALSARVP